MAEQNGATGLIIFRGARAPDRGYPSSARTVIDQLNGVTLAKPVVLIVEDNEETADVLGRILGLRGYHVVFASDGLEALAYLRGGLGPAAIILDLALPNLDGRALRTALLATPALARIPIVVYSAVSGGEQLPGIIGHVRKGFDDPDVLLGFLQAACARGPRPVAR